MSAVVDPVGAGPPVVTTAPPALGTSVGRSSVLLSAASGAVGLVSYGCGLAMAHLLPTGAYGGFAAAQMLLTIVGTVAASLVPLPLAERVRATRPGSAPRRAAVSFAVQVSLALGVASAAVTGTVALGFAPPSVAAAVAVSALAIAAVAPVWGWLQGEAQFGRYAVATVAEVTLRLVVSVVVVLAGARAWGAIMGFAAGALLIVGCGVGWLRRDLTWRWGALRPQWADTGAIAVTQLVLSALVAADVLVVAFSGAVSPDAAGFQALATLAKGPVYVAAGVVVVLYPLLRARGADAGPALDRALRTFLRIALLAAVVLATVPIEVAALVLPAAYLPALFAAPSLAVAGLGYGVVTVGVTVLLALRRGARSRLGLATSVALIGAGLGIGHSLGGVPGLAAGAAVGAAGAAAVVGRLLSPLLTAGVVRAAARASGVAAVGLVLLELTRHAALVWAAVATVAAVFTVWGLRGERSASSADRTGRLRILHLGFEDPAMPGSGGGSLRTHETARRIAVDHDVTVLAQRYPGCAARVQDGVRYEHVGIGAGRTRLTRVLGYMVRLPSAVRGRAADLVVEDFFAPVSTIGAPLWSGKPTVGVVQWLNAREKAAQYKVPVHLVERFGVRRHRRLVAVSDGLRGRLLALNPALHVEVIGNGVAQEAFAPEPALGAGVVYVGRLEIAQKGLDLLLDAWRLVHPRIRGELVIAGTGPDEPRLRARVAALGLADRVRFAGWVDGAAKFALMASARVVAVPSRYETFGIVAIEAAATGTPVVAFDIDCLREVVPDVCGRRVPPFDVPAYAAALVATHDDLRWIEDGAAQRRTFARSRDWDSVAARQQRVYVEAAGPP